MTNLTYCAEIGNNVYGEKSAITQFGLSKAGGHGNMYELNKRFAELCSCPISDFISSPTLVLKEMMRREDWPEFSKVSGFWNVPFQARTKYFINVDYILDETEGLLLKAAIEFLERSQKP